MNYSEPQAQADIYSVSRLNAEVRLALELQFRQLWLCGEISNFVAASSGHWYFSLKDQAAQVKAAMFKQSNRNAAFRPQNGQQVLVRARISVYEPRGEYQLLIDFIEPYGDGLLRQQYEMLKAQLAAEGLFAPERKRVMPTQVKKVGVITSPTGAAVRDILTVLARRAPNTEVVIYPALVQGQQAPQDLLAALAHAIRRHEVDVLIIGRGGGSLEDLACFNDETLARAIAQCPIPIISAVGHEIDFTIADFVADLRAATPSAAAELVSTDQRQQLQQLNQISGQLHKAARNFLAQKAMHFSQLARQLQLLHPKRKLEQQQQCFDELQSRLTQQMTQQLTLNRLKQQQLTQQLSKLSPNCAQMSTQLNTLQQRAMRAIEQQIKHERQRWQATSAQLHQVSPLATLQRGYAVAKTPSGELIDSVALLPIDTAFRLQLNDGEVMAKTTATLPGPVTAKSDNL